MRDIDEIISVIYDIAVLLEHLESEIISIRSELEEMKKYKDKIFRQMILDS